MIIKRHPESYWATTVLCEAVRRGVCSHFFPVVRTLLINRWPGRISEPASLADCHEFAWIALRIRWKVGELLMGNCLIQVPPPRFSHTKSLSKVSIFRIFMTGGFMFTILEVFTPTPPYAAYNILLAGGFYRSVIFWPCHPPLDTTFILLSRFGNIFVAFLIFKDLYTDPEAKQRLHWQ